MSSNDLYRMPSSCPNVSMLLDHLVTLVPGEHVLYVRSVQPLPLYPETDWQLESSTRAEPVVGILPIYLITSRTHASQAMRESLPRYEGEDFVSALNAPYVQQPDMVVKYKYNRAVLAERNEGDVVVWADDLFTMIKNFLQLHRQLYAQYLHGIPDKLQNAEIQTAMKERVLPGRASSSDTNVVSQYQPRVPVDSPMLYDGPMDCEVDYLPPRRSTSPDPLLQSEHFLDAERSYTPPSDDGSDTGRYQPTAWDIGPLPELFPDINDDFGYSYFFDDSPVVRLAESEELPLSTITCLTVTPVSDPIPAPASPTSRESSLTPVPPSPRASSPTHASSSARAPSLAPRPPTPCANVPRPLLQEPVRRSVRQAARRIAESDASPAPPARAMRPLPSRAVVSPPPLPPRQTRSSSGTGVVLSGCAMDVDGGDGRGREDGGGCEDALRSADGTREGEDDSADGDYNESEHDDDDEDGSGDYTGGRWSSSTRKRSRPTSTTRPGEPAGDGPAPKRVRRRRKHGTNEKRESFRCKDCPKSFTRAADLKRHQERSCKSRPHSGPLCLKCGKSFSRTDSLDRHNMKVDCRANKSKTQGNRGSRK